MASAVAPAPPSADMPSPAEATASEPQGILLYYKYVPLEGDNAEEAARFYTDLCTQLDLRGRIRVARDGVNVTVGGSMAALRAHAAAVVSHPLLRGGDIDFKFATSGGPRNEATRTETKMDRLVVRLCEELVTLGPLARHRADPWVSTATHLTPEQFHDMLQRATATAAAAPSFPAPPATATAAAPPAGPVSWAAPPPEAGTSTASDGGRAATAAAADMGNSSCQAVGSEGEARGEDATSSGAAASGSSDAAAGPVVLLDARNVYETRIGRFDAGPGVALLDPRTRCFSDLPAWMDAHEQLLRNRTVLMYCTGGVRCERASAYLREKGPEFSSVFQLSGGIQRYLEAFPDGGFFRGKNFLYDDRIAVGPEEVQPASPAAVVGRCLVCGCAWDDYGARLRCSRCRLLVLVCDSCNTAHLQHHHHQQQQEQEEEEGRSQQPQQPTTGPQGSAACFSGRQQGTHGSAPPPPVLLCELCSTTAEAGGAEGADAAPWRVADGAPEAAGAAAVAEARASAGDPGRPAASPHPSDGPAACGSGSGSAAAEWAGAGAAPCPRRLRILCLHGFRQTAKQFQGRTCALRKKLRDLADFVFVDGPHTLPLFVKQQQGGEGGTATVAAAAAATVTGNDAAASTVNAAAPAAVNTLVSHYVDGNLTDTEEVETGDVQAVAEAEDGTAICAAPAAPSIQLAAKRAWLLPPELYGSGGGAAAADVADGLREAPSYVDELQYTRQTEGWSESLAALRGAVRELGPFDGVFGFSQGASVAAVLCALQQRQQQRQPSAASDPRPSTSPAAPWIWSDDDETDNDDNDDGTADLDFGFRFAVLASGFPSPAPQHRQLLADVGPLELPSLHVYGVGAAGGVGAADRQICPRESEALAAAFSCAGGARRSLCHQCGHLIPATKGHAATFRAFLSQFT